MEIAYPVEPLEGDAFPCADGAGEISLRELSLLLNDPKTQERGLSTLGVTLTSNGASLSVHFVERGKAYSDPEGDRTKTDAEASSASVEKTFKLPQRASLPLKFKIYLGGWNQEGINFLGRIEVAGGFVLPLTGRGTAALEGRTGDAHAGFCTGAACASFQERAALILGACVAAGAQSSAIRELGEAFFPINECFHGRAPILHYTLHCALLHDASAGSYRSFFANGAYQVDEVMRPLLEHGETPGAAYFAKLAQKFSTEEQAAVRSLPPSLSAPPKPPAVEPSLYPVLALPGAPIPLVGGGVGLTIDQLAELLNEPDNQMKTVQQLGFSFTPGQSSVLLEFKEKGKAYCEPLADRTKVANDESEQEFVKRLGLSVPIVPKDLTPLPLKVILGGWLQDGVNFLGRVEVTTSAGLFVLPLTGRGTAALEGRSGDAHAGFCTGGACAAFQNRAALSMAIALTFAVHDDHLETLCGKLQALNSCYHGRDDILDYTLQCAISTSPGSYLDFMKARYPTYYGRPPLLESILSTGIPNVAYFDKLAQKFSPEELEAERRRKNPIVEYPEIMDNRPLEDNVTSEDNPPEVNTRTEFDDIKEVEIVNKEELKESKGIDTFTKAAIGVTVCMGVVIIIVFFTVRK